LLKEESTRKLEKHVELNVSKIVDAGLVEWLRQ
jgi:hypothetical protein